MKKELPQGFYFDEAHHRYYLDGKQMTGVTTVLGILAKPALIAWSSRMACEYIRDNYSVGCAMETLLQEAQNAYAKKRDKAADIGTQAHAWCEAYIKGENPAEVSDLKIMTDNFLRWVGEVKPKFLASEKKVHSVKYFYAGTLDFLCEIDGKTYLGDLKTGSGIYPEMFWQCAGYQLALEETEPEIKVEGHIIVNITKDGKLNTQTHYDYDSTKEGFLAALKIYRLLNNQ